MLHGNSIKMQSNCHPPLTEIKLVLLKDPLKFRASPVALLSLETKQYLSLLLDTTQSLTQGQEALEIRKQEDGRETERVEARIHMSW